MNIETLIGTKCGSSCVAGWEAASMESGRRLGWTRWHLGAVLVCRIQAQIAWIPRHRIRTCHRKLGVRPLPQEDLKLEWSIFLINASTLATRWASLVRIRTWETSISTWSVTIKALWPRNMHMNALAIDYFIYRYGDSCRVLKVGLILIQLELPFRFVNSQLAPLWLLNGSQCQILNKVCVAQTGLIFMNIGLSQCSPERLFCALYGLIIIEISIL